MESPHEESTKGDRLLYGLMKGDEVILTDPDVGKPIVEAVEPEAPEGYHTEVSYFDAGSELKQSWSLVPDEGTAAEAAIALAKMQAQSLSDEDASKVPALYDEWSGDGVEYAQGDRVRFQGTLCKCLQAHTSQADWAPNAAPSLWSLILPGQDGSGVGVGVWQQPDSTNGYSTGDKVLYDGHIWESTQDDNVWKPGDVGAPWTDLGEWDGASSMKPADAHFA